MNPVAPPQHDRRNTSCCAEGFFYSQRSAVCCLRRTASARVRRHAGSCAPRRPCQERVSAWTVGYPSRIVGTQGKPGTLNHRPRDRQHGQHGPPRRVEHRPSPSHPRQQHLERQAGSPTSRKTRCRRRWPPGRRAARRIIRRPPQARSSSRSAPGTGTPERPEWRAAGRPGRRRPGAEQQPRGAHRDRAADVSAVRRASGSTAQRAPRRCPDARKIRTAPTIPR